MIQSVTFGKDFQVVGKDMKLSGKNTYDDWQLLATDRPIISPPEPKTHFIDIPGGNGALDLSEALTGFPIYNNRTGSFQFRVLNVGIAWTERLSGILEAIHGKSMKIVLEDEPDWFYQGRITVDWNNGPTWSLVTINVNVGPFKWFMQTSLDDWLWDPFSFENGVTNEGFFSSIPINTVTNLYNQANIITGGYFQAATGNFIQNASYASTDLMPVLEGSTYVMPTGTIRNITFWDANKKYVSGSQAVSTMPITIPRGVAFVRALILNPSEVTTFYFRGAGVRTFDAVHFGSAPISPAFIVSGASNLQVRFINSFLGIDKTVTLVNGRNDIPDFIFYGLSSYSLTFTGTGTVSIEFRKGRL